MTPERWIISVSIALTVCILELACLKALSPHEEIKPEVTTTIDADHSTVTQTTFNFQGVASKTGWGMMGMFLLAFTINTVRMYRREQAADVMIQAIESCGHEAVLVKSQVQRKNNPWITKRVARLTKKV